MKRNCEKCGAEIVRKPSKFRASVFCCRACYDASQSIFTETDLGDIVCTYNAGAKQRELAERYGVNQSVISKALTRARKRRAGK